MKSLALKIFLLIILVACLMTLLPSCGHTHTSGDWITDKLPTCTDGGIMHKECTSCGEVLATDVIPTTNHSYADGECSLCGDKDPDYVAPGCKHELVSHTAKEPTCTEIGWDAYEECSKCDYTTYAEIAALDHDEIAHGAKAPTCTEIGWDAYVTCSRCDYTTYNEKAVLAHTYVIYPGNAATCTEGGLTDGVICSVCSYVSIEREPIPAAGHVYDDELDESCNECGSIRDVNCKHNTTVVIPGYATTCTASGLTDGLMCVECGEIIEKQTVIGAPGHDEIAHGAKDPTCTEIGWDAYVTCSRCDYTTYNEKAALDHDEVAHDAKTPTCTEIGWDAYVTCSRCDYTTYNEKVALGHSMESAAGHQASCESSGYEPYNYCTVCGYSEPRVTIPALGHKEVKIPGYAATCTENGLTDGKRCDRCGKTIERQWPIIADGHNIVSEAEKPATCTEDGHSAHKRCTKCDYTEVYEVTAALGHDEVAHGAKTPTCTEIGWDAYVTCTRCDYSTYKEIEALGHNFVGGACTVCGEAKPNTDIKYTILDEFTCYVSGYTGSESTVIIPSVAPDGRTVVGIGNNAFGSNYDITSVILPKTIIAIGEGAFMGCTYLSEITLPEGITEIGEFAFYRTSSLSEIVLPDSLKIIGDHAFSACYNLTKVHIGSGVTKIGASAFEGCGSITEISIPEGVTEIGSFAFCNCYGIKSIVIPDSVTSIGECALKDCYGLESITIPFLGATKDGGMARFTHLFGSLHSSQYIYVPDSIKTVIITGGTEIGEYAFNGCMSIQSIILPDTITVIGNGAFENCMSLTEIVIPAGVTEIFGQPFYGCTSLVIITVDPTNKNYASVDGNLYDKNQTTLLTYAPGKNEESFTVPDGVTMIAPSAFKDNAYLRTVIFPQTLLIIAENAFYGCDVLNVIEIKLGLIEIGVGAFYDCPILLIKFGGTEEDFKSIIIAGNNDVLDNATFVSTHVCTPGEAVKENEREATCTEGGYYDLVTYCSDPNCPKGRPEMSRESINTPMASHDYVDGFCKWCKREKVSEGLEFASNGDGTCYVSSIGKCTDTVIIIPTVSPTGLKVTGIGKNAFKGQTHITSVLFHEGITTIGDYAFYECSGIHELNLPKGLTTIGTWAFYKMTGLRTLTIPESVTSIGKYAIASCNNIETLVLPFVGASRDAGADTDHFGYIFSEGLSGSSEENKYVVESIRTVIITDATLIGSDAFRDCKYITKIEINEGLTSIEASAFSGCTALTDINIPSTVISIGDYVFNTCSSLASITIPSTVVSIGNYVFNSCTSLAYKEYGNTYYLGNDSNPYLVLVQAKNKSITSCTINENTKFILGYAFQGCKYLTEVSIPASATEIGSGILKSCTALTKASLPSSMTSIPYEMFSSCTQLAEIAIPSGVKSISVYAFSYCTALKSIVLPDGVTTIGNYAFSKCTALEYIMIPASLESIGNYAFSNCSALSTVYYKGTPEQYEALKSNTGYVNESFTNIAPTYVHDCIAGEAVKENVVEATCTVGGSYDLVVYCTVRGEEISRESVNTEALGHDYANNLCTRCGKERVSEGLKFYSNGDGTCVVTGIGYCADNDVVIPAVSPDGDTVVAIGYRAFRYSNFYSITIPDTVTTIRESAFSNAKLGVINLGNGVKEIETQAFYSCTNLTSITIPDSVTTIGSSLFYKCTGLTSVTIGKGVTKIVDYLFSGCTALREVIIPESITEVESSAFYECTALAYNAYDNANYLGSIENPYMILIAVKNDSITSCTINSNTKIIASYAFSYCKNIQSIVIPEGVKSICNNAFEQCENLSNITIPSSVTSIGVGTFYFCQNLTTVTIPSGVDIVSDYTFYACQALKSVTISDGVTSIGEYAFYHCDVLTSITIPNTVTKIGNSAFDGCSKLTSIIIPNSLMSIDKWAFYDCISLTTVYYTGTPEQYAAIEIGDYNSAFTAITPTYPTAPAEPAYTRDGDYIYFGEYPQTIKADDVTITDTKDERGYYLGSDGYYYAAVVATPQGLTYKFTNDEYIESDVLYYFKVEPIRWRILEEKDGKAFLLCDSIIAGMPFDGTTENYSNNYAESDIRAWLNEQFYNTAFGELQREIILLTMLDNSKESTADGGGNPNTCVDTEDKIFLLSGAEATNESYGFSSNTTNDYIRELQSSDHARASGVWMSTNRGYVGNGYWWLRSPHYNNYNAVYQINAEGKLYESYRAAYGNSGVVPALWIKL